LTAILLSTAMPKLVKGLVCVWGVRPRVGRPRSTMASALTLGGLQANRIMFAVSFSLRRPLNGCPGSISHSSAGTYMENFEFGPEMSTTGTSCACFSLREGYSVEE